MDHGAGSARRSRLCRAWTSRASLETKKGTTLRWSPFTFSEIELRSDLADASRPVAKSRARTWKLRGPRAGTEEIVPGSAGEEWATPGRVIARVRDVLARYPD